jgi:hypothetical protein
MTKWISIFCYDLLGKTCYCLQNRLVSETDISLLVVKPGISITRKDSILSILLLNRLRSLRDSSGTSCNGPAASVEFSSQRITGKRFRMAVPQSDSLRALPYCTWLTPCRLTKHGLLLWCQCPAGIAIKL